MNLTKESTEKVFAAGEWEKELQAKFDGPIVTSWEMQECRCKKMKCICFRNLKKFIRAENQKKLTELLSLLELKD